MRLKIESGTLKGLLKHLGVIAGLLSLLSFAFFYQVLPVTTNRGKVVTVPDLRGMTLDDAIKSLSIKNLNYIIGDSTFDSQKSSLTVVEQFPKPLAQVKIDRKIYIRLNAKIAPSIKYPDLTGSTFELALEQLKALDLKIGTIEYRPDLAHDAILESKANEKLLYPGQLVSKGTIIDLVVGLDSLNDSKSLEHQL